MPVARQMIGECFGRLTVVEFAGHVHRSGARYRQWRCRCLCGNEVTAVTGALTTGNTQSCGCRKRDETVARLTRHGGRHTPEYVVWNAMRKRCENPKNAKYADYGGRGILVCERWRDFANFLADMGRRPSTRHSIERIDNDRGYEPENCAWVLRETQNRNQRQRADNSSGHTGVIWHKNSRKWEAFIGFKGQRVYIGQFADINDAVAARKAKAAELGFNPNHGGSR